MGSMKPPFKKTVIGVAMEFPEAGVFDSVKFSAIVAPIEQKINKIGPFKLSKVTDEYPYFSDLLSRIVQQSIRELPDFSDDSKIAVMSDFGGEHSSAKFHTYSFLFLAYNKVGPFEEKIRELRKKYGLLEHYSEFAYKNLSSGAKARALPEYLRLVDSFIHGAIITIAIDKRIETVFGAQKKQAQSVMVAQLKEEGLGEWHGPGAEKVLRIVNIIAAFASLLTHENQRLLWYSDRDLINEDGKKWNFTHTQQILVRVLGMYLSHRLDVVGFAKSFKEKGHLDDLLSVPDLAAGVVQDLLFQNETGEDIPGGDEKAMIMQWIATPARYLSKLTIQIVRTADGGIGFGRVDMAVKR
ncbi:hypothetical protein [Burkholderia cepacia]|uniref:hypothetical protein n=1 Tax=Burkholderia cepacia TaxID=292 RepID=UPI00264D1E11|nr:hypothetical protein [Burkholderia cepacia]MDN7636082.1 hypothetical protein [Burkholderia cepacia]HDR9184266.1 hypothetical protein [Burkholderia vietnamiensis]